jgi:tRNA(Ile2)-agmatinylcytidine synthase
LRSIGGNSIIWLGIDDTDSPEGGCTTYLALEVFKTLEDWVPMGYPRLVRLNPNIPWKTRGNGAIALRLEHRSVIENLGLNSAQQSKNNQIGETDSKEVLGHDNITNRNDPINPTPDIESLFEKTCSVIEQFCKIEDPNTNPGVVVAHKPLSEKLYWQAVRDIVELSDIKKILANGNCLYKGYKNQRGLIGAAAAISWDPAAQIKSTGPVRTFELITYREKKRWGTNRDWHPNSAGELDLEIPTSFDNYDRVNKIPRIAPNTPCPVFYGVRGTVAADLKKVLSIIKTREAVDRWVIFETNHGTDDHIQEAKISTLKPFQSIQIEGTVTADPVALKGGHTFFWMDDKEGNTLACAAYEPTKQFRDIVRGLVTGDEVIIYGGLRRSFSEGKNESGLINGGSNSKTIGTGMDPPTVNLEKLHVTYMIEQKSKTGNPRCPKCGKSTKSIGHNQGYRCRVCKIHIKEDAVITRSVKRDLQVGFYEVPVCARRHLSCPLKLIKS